MIKRIKLAYKVYNFFNKRKLIHNVSLYKKFGLKKSYFSSISSDDFTDIDFKKTTSNNRLETLDHIPFYNQQTDESKLNIQKFDDLGYCVIKNFLKKDKVNLINTEISRLMENGSLTFRNRNKLMFAIDKSTILNDLFDYNDWNQFLDYLIDGEAKLFQSINFITGSEQRTHSDSIHMTTFPTGGLLGIWIALEDINTDNGPIHYYPKSHDLPYYMNKDYNNQGNKFLLGNQGYTAYEEMIATKIQSDQFQKKIFLAKPGDLFIWHANLLHGGEPLINKESTRKSMVLHYYDTKRICYHEITQRPALIKRS